MKSNRGPPPNPASEASLDKILREDPTLDMDLMQFLVITGFTYVWKPLEVSENQLLHRQVYDRYIMRRSKISSKTKKLETRICNAVSAAYEDEYWPTKTLRDLKHHIEEKSAGKVDIPNLNLVSVAYLNAVLRHYGVDEINISVTSTTVKARINSLDFYRPPV